MYRSLIVLYLCGNERTIPIVIVPASIVLSIDETPYDFEVTLFCAPLGVYVLD